MRDLRAFAVSLSGSFHQADDLLQETLLKAWSNSGSFIPGTNMRAWLVTILRNTYYSQYRKRGREVSDTDGVYSGQLATPPNQEASRRHGGFPDRPVEARARASRRAADGRRVRAFL